MAPIRVVATFSLRNESAVDAKEEFEFASVEPYVLLSSVMRARMRRLGLIRHAISR